MAKATSIADTGNGGAGSASLAGYEYQIDVSVWLVLDLILVSRLTENLVLEPASQEDLEAELSDAEPGRLVSRVAMTDYTLIVQVKRRGGDAWTPTTLKTLINYGSDKRMSAAKRLIDPKTRYLLVTSAGLNGDANKLKRRKAVGSWPKAEAMPSVIAKSINHNIAGRVAVIANQDDERLSADIDRLLTEGCRVPNALLEACRNKLREEARARIVGAGGGRWSRQDVEDVIRKHEGYLASAPELEHYVHPNNWGGLREAMAQDAAAIIIGQSGTGKTLATKMLYDELRKEMPGLTRVPIRLGPSQLRDDTTPPPVLYDIEDPWGRFNFDPKSRPWNDQLASFFSAARPDQMIIATSRRDVAQASGALATVKPWVVALEAENYGSARRQKLYRTRIASLPRELQPLARVSERQVLAELATPLEIQKFFDAMRTQDREGLKNPPGFVSAAINGAHQNSIETNVIEQIEARQDVRAAAIIWALLIAGDKITRPLLRELDDGLADTCAAMENGVSPLVDFFIAARNLRQSEDGIITYYHPRVEAGITKTLEKHRQPVRQTLCQLIDLLVSADGPDAEWGAGAAARILARARDQFKINPSAGAVVKIDAWLEIRLVEGGKAFESHLELAARSGSAACNGAEIARFLLHRPDPTFAGMTSWGKPVKPPEWYTARASDQSTRLLVENFIRHILPSDRVHYPTSFADDLSQLSDRLAPAFIDAASVAVHYGYISSDDAIAYGALTDIEAFEAVVDAAAEVLTPSEDDIRKARETRLDIINDVYSDDYAQHLSEDDDGYTASEFLKAYVQRVRQVKGWQSVAQHQHAKRLRSYWLRLLADDARNRPINHDELAGALSAGYGTEDEDDLWLALLKSWDVQFLTALEGRVLEGSPNVYIEQAALTCLIEHSPSSFARIVTELLKKSDNHRLVEISLILADLLQGKSRDTTKHVKAAKSALAVLPQPFAAICNTEIALLKKETPILTDPVYIMLAAIADAGPKVRAFRLELDATTAFAVEDDVRWALDEAEDPEIAILAIEAAIRREMAPEIDAALDHKFAHVVARAVTAVATPCAGPLPQRLLSLAAHRASPVRRALANALKAKTDIAHLPVLLKLAGDEWSRDTMNYGTDSDDYPIARTAVDALGTLSPLGEANDSALLVTGTETSDPKVRDAIFRLLTKFGGAVMQRKLFEQAVQPGTRQVRWSAAHALLLSGDELAQAVVDEIRPHLVATRYEPVAAVLVLLLGWRGTIPVICETAEQLAIHPKRRVLLLLLVWLLKDRDLKVAEEIAAMLPLGHDAVAWALGDPLVKVDDAMIADLGDQVACAEVLRYA